MRVAWVALLALGACIHAPEIVVVDRPTALEQQAAGSFDELEKKLVRTGIAPRPVPLTPDELEALGIRAAPLDTREKSPADLMDALLRQRCIGEASNGTLVDTPETCRGAVDHAEVTGLIERINHARSQLWRWMQERKPSLSLEEVRRAWIKVHVRSIGCGGWMQREDGGWEAKKC